MPKLIIVQWGSTHPSLCENSAALETWLSQQSILPGDLLIFPEMALTGYTMDETMRQQSTAMFCQSFFLSIASKYQCYIAAGIAWQNETHQSFNSLFYGSPKGQWIGRYDKQKTFTLNEESSLFKAGDSAAPIWKWHDFFWRPLICFDLRFPELTISPQSVDIDLLIYIAAWPAIRKDHWLSLLKARAIENQCYVAGCNTVGTVHHTQYSGDSIIYDPMGNMISQASILKNSFIEATLDPALSKSTKQSLPLHHR
jgi:predicted amidohydrolase